MDLDKKRKLSLFLTIATVALLILGIIGVILGSRLAVGYQTTLLWVSMTGILPLSVITGIIAFVVDFSYRKEKNTLEV